MKLLVDRKGLLDALDTVGPFCLSRSTIKPILEDVKLSFHPDDGSTLMATDLEMGIRARVLGVQCDEPGQVILPRQSVQRFLAASREEKVSIEVEEKRLTIHDLHSRIVLATHDPDLMPSVPEFPEGTHATLEAADIAKAIKRTVYACDVDSTKYALGGCYFSFQKEEAIVCATDGRRFCRQIVPCEISGQGDIEQVILPRKGAIRLGSLLSDEDWSVRVATSNRFFWANCPEFEFFSRLQEGRFPIIYSKEHLPVYCAEKSRCLTVAPEELRSAISKACASYNDTNHVIEFQIGDGVIALKYEREGASGGSQMSVDYESPKTAFYIDHDYINELLKSVGGDELIEIDLSSGDEGIKFRTVDGMCSAIHPIITKGN